MELLCISTEVRDTWPHTLSKGMELYTYKGEFYYMQIRLQEISFKQKNLNEGQRFLNSLPWDQIPSKTASGTLAKPASQTRGIWERMRLDMGWDEQELGTVCLQLTVTLWEPQFPLWASPPSQAEQERCRGCAHWNLRGGHFLHYRTWDGDLGSECMVFAVTVGFFKGKVQHP